MTAIDRAELRFDAEAHLQYGGGGDDLAYGVLALLGALTRAEAQSETRRQQTKYWQERADLFEAKMNELDRAYISEHGQRRRAEDERDRLKGKLARRSETASRLLEERNNAEARIKHLESTTQVLVREALQAEKARDERRRGKAEAEARIQAVLDEAPTIPEANDPEWGRMSDQDAGVLFAWEAVLDILNG